MDGEGTLRDISAKKEKSRRSGSPTVEKWWEDGGEKRGRIAAGGPGLDSPKKLSCVIASEEGKHVTWPHQGRPDESLRINLS